MHSKKQLCTQKCRLWSSKCVCMVLICVRQRSLVTSPLRCSWMWHQVMYLPLSPSVLRGRITIFLSLKENNFEIAISCFDKFCVGNSNSTLTFISALCSPAFTWHTIQLRLPQCCIVHMWTYWLSRNKSSKGKVFLGNLQSHLCKIWQRMHSYPNLIPTFRVVSLILTR